MDNKLVYIDNIVVGSLIAFKLAHDDQKLISGKVTSIKNDSFGVQTKNGTQYEVTKDNIAWVNTNGRWPKGVMDAFKIRVEGEKTHGDATDR